MKTRSVIACWTMLAWIAALPAQTECIVSTVLLVQFGPGDLVLNEPLVEAFVDDPDLEAQLLRLGSEVTGFDGIGVDMPAPQTPGTFQIHLNICLKGPNETLSRATHDKVAYAVRDHLRRRFETLLYEQPQAQLTARREELSQRLADLSHQRAEHRARADEAAAGASELAKVRESLAQQVLATGLDLATEQRAVSHLQALRDRQDEQRQRIEAQHREIGDRIDRLQGEVAEITSQISAVFGTGDQAKLKALQDACREVEKDLVQRRRDQDASAARLAEANNMLAHTLEQLPVCTLALQRAQARADALAAEQKQTGQRAAAAAARVREAAELETRIEQLQIDTTVCRTLLTEVQGKLARLEPVRCELLRRR